MTKEQRHDNLIKRFFDKTYPEPNTGCWLWGGDYYTTGYGIISSSGKSTSAHRFSYSMFKGSPHGNYVLHKCDVRGCVNPDHLFLGTQKDNIQDMIKKGRRVGNLKLDKTSKLVIEEAYLAGHRIVEIANYFKMSRTWIGSIGYKAKRKTLK